MAMPICWERKSERSEIALASKKKCCALGLATTHNASLGLVHTCHGTPSLRSTTRIMFDRPLGLVPSIQPVAAAMPVEEAWRCGVYEVTATYGKYL